MEEASIRKQIWERKDLVDAKVAEPEFLELPDDEQDAIVISLQLDMPLEAVKACVANTASEVLMTELKSRLAETFKYGKRKALRSLKEAISSHPHLTIEE